MDLSPFTAVMDDPYKTQLDSINELEWRQWQRRHNVLVFPILALFSLVCFDLAIRDEPDIY